MTEIAARLAELSQLGLERRTRLVEGPQGAEVLLDGRQVTLLCSNNYLGLAAHRSVRQAAAEAALQLGAGAGASRLVSGTMSVHRELERALADFEGAQACLLFGSGYLANVGLIGALAGRRDVVFSDELNHASIVDGCRLSRAEVVVYRHLDVEHLESCLANRRGQGRALIVTDSVFSMDGDVAPLPEIVELAKRHRARVLVDEAHAIGAIGPGGRGALAAAGLAVAGAARADAVAGAARADAIADRAHTAAGFDGEVDALIGTLGKALGSYGAYVCGSAELVRYLVNVCRPFIFSTAPPPPAIAAAHAALQLLQSEPSLVQDLRAAARCLRAALRDEGFAVRESEMHIVPLVVGEQRATSRLCEAALQRGVFAQAIRPPTVPAGTSRLRLAASASHSPQQMRAAARSLRQAAEEAGLDPRRIGEPSMQQVGAAA